MASVNWKGKNAKSHGGCQAKANLRHSMTDERLIHHHSNPDIDLSLTPENWSLYGLSYEEACDKYDRRVKALNEEYERRYGKSPRKDQVTMQSLIIYRPSRLPKDQYDAWAHDVCEILKDQFKPENIIEIEAHKDEIHHYKHFRTGEDTISVEHLHAHLTPEIDGILNAKKFSNIGAIQKLNKAIHDMTKEKYHVLFNTGEYAKNPQRHENVERLKQMSAIQEAKAIVIAEAKKEAVEISDKADLDANKIIREALKDAEKIKEKAKDDIVDSPDFQEKLINELMHDQSVKDQGAEIYAKRIIKDNQTHIRQCELFIRGDLDGLTEMGVQLYKQSYGERAFYIGETCIKTPKDAQRMIEKLMLGIEQQERKIRDITKGYEH